MPTPPDTELDAAAQARPQDPRRGAEKLAELPRANGPDTEDTQSDIVTRQWEPGQRAEGDGPVPASAMRAGSAVDLSLEPALLDADFNERYVMRELLGRGGMGEVR